MMAATKLVIRTAAESCELAMCDFPTKRVFQLTRFNALT